MTPDGGAMEEMSQIRASVMIGKRQAAEASRKLEDF